MIFKKVVYHFYYQKFYKYWQWEFFYFNMVWNKHKVNIVVNKTGATRNKTYLQSTTYYFIRAFTQNY